MQDVAKIIKLGVASALRSLYKIDNADVSLEHPQNPKWGDYSTNSALVYAKKLGKDPMEVAKDVSALLFKSALYVEDFGKELLLFSDVSVAHPGFINFRLSRELLFCSMLCVLKEGSKFGSQNIGLGKRVALEHSNVNPNKAAHVGHLRNAVIGQFIERTYEYLGYDVQVQYYSNDLGLQVTTSLLGMQVLGTSIDASKYKKFDHYAWDVYSKFSSMLDVDPKLKSRLEELMLKLETGDTAVTKEQTELSGRILKDNLCTFAALGIDYDLIVYESSIKQFGMWEKAFERLKSNENVYLGVSGASTGCWLVRVSDDASKKDTALGVEEDKIIVRSNGIPTYTGKDIAYHMWKFGLLGQDFRYREYDTDTQKKLLYETSTTGVDNDAFTNSSLVLDVIDVRQTYAIDVVRKSLAYLGYQEQSESLIHVNYGHVYLSSATAEKMGFTSTPSTNVGMSGRKGVGVKIDDLITIVSETLASQFAGSPNQIDVRNAVIKFDMLRYDTFQDVIFDVDSALNLKGFTGPYIQYTHARAVSVLEKSGQVFDISKLPSYFILNTELALTSRELEVIALFGRFPEIVVSSATSFAPNLLCNYLYTLCQRFNSFYNDAPILNAEDPRVRELRLLLTSAVRQVLRNGLYLLGINAVDKM